MLPCYTRFTPHISEQAVSIVHYLLHIICQLVGFIAGVSQIRPYEVSTYWNNFPSGKLVTSVALTFIACIVYVYIAPDQNSL